MINKVNNLFFELEHDFVCSHVSNNQEKNDLLDIIEEFKCSSHELRDINYDKFWRAFNELYSLKNLYKALLTIVYAQDNFSLDLFDYEEVADIGCGTGVFSIAWCCVRNNQNFRLKLIDKNYYQLESAKIQLDKLKIRNADYIYDKFPHPQIGEDSIKLYSYWFCEQNNISKIILEDEKKLFGKGALIIDYYYMVELIRNTVSDKYICHVYSIPIIDAPSYISDPEGGANSSYVNFAYICRR